MEAMNAHKQEWNSQLQNDSLQDAAAWFCQEVITKNASGRKIPLSGHLFPEGRYYEP